MLDEGETLDVDCVPVYTHLMDYFNDDDRKISQVFISLTDKTENKRLQINQTFWNNQNNSSFSIVAFLIRCLIDKTSLMSVIPSVFSIQKPEAQAVSK